MDNMDGQTAGPKTLDELVESLTEEELATLWKFGLFEDSPLPDRYRRAVLRILEDAAASVVRVIERVFASFDPHEWARAVVALLFRRVRAKAFRRAQLRVPSLVRRMTSQAGHGALAPVRGSPGRALHMCPVKPGAPPM